MSKVDPFDTPTTSTPATTPGVVRSNRFTAEEMEPQPYSSFRAQHARRVLESMVGKTFSLVHSYRLDGDDFLCFEHAQGTIMFYYDHDCCAKCDIESIDGDLHDLAGSPLVMAEVVTEKGDAGDDGSCTWSFYKFATAKGYVTVRWYGSSNGYYSEEVSVKWVGQ